MVLDVAEVPYGDALVRACPLSGSCLFRSAPFRLVSTVEDDSVIRWRLVRTATCADTDEFAYQARLSSDDDGFPLVSPPSVTRLAPAAYVALDRPQGIGRSDDPEPHYTTLQAFGRVDPTPVTIRVGAACATPTGWTATANVPWLRVTPAQGGLAGGFEDVQIGADVSALDPAQGPFTGLVTVTSPASEEPIVIEVVLHLAC